MVIKTSLSSGKDQWTATRSGSLEKSYAAASVSMPGAWDNLIAAGTHI